MAGEKASDYLWGDQSKDSGGGQNEVTAASLTWGNHGGGRSENSGHKSWFNRDYTRDTGRRDAKASRSPRAPKPSKERGESVGLLKAVAGWLGGKATTNIVTRVADPYSRDYKNNPPGLRPEDVKRNADRIRSEQLAKDLARSRQRVSDQIRHTQQARNPQPERRGWRNRGAGAVVLIAGSAGAGALTLASHGPSGSEAAQTAPDNPGIVRISEEMGIVVPPLLEPGVTIAIGKVGLAGRAPENPGATLGA